MINRLNKKLFFIFGLAGFLFSGYLSAVKLFTSICAFNEPCPYFLGYPACWYGFAMFSLIFLAAILGLLDLVSEKRQAIFTGAVSLVGIIFAGYFTVPEINKLLSGAAILGLLDLVSEKRQAIFTGAVSLVGIIFAGYFTVPEINKLLSGAAMNYSLGLPTCSYGLMFYISIFILSVKASRVFGN